MATRFYIRTTGIQGRTLVGGWDQDRRLLNRVMAPAPRILTQSRTIQKVPMNNVVEDSRKNMAMFLLESPVLVSGQTISGTVMSLWECSQQEYSTTSAQACAQIFAGIVDKNGQLLATLVPLKSGAVSSIWGFSSSKRYFAWAQSSGTGIQQPVEIDPNWDAPRLRVEIGVSQQNNLTYNATYGPGIYPTSNNAGDLSGTDGSTSGTSVNGWIEFSSDLTFTADLETSSSADHSVYGQGSYFAERRKKYATVYEPGELTVTTPVDTHFEQIYTTLQMEAGEQVAVFYGGRTTINSGTYDRYSTDIRVVAGSTEIAKHNVGKLQDYYDWTPFTGVSLYEAQEDGEVRFSVLMANSASTGQTARLRESYITVVRLDHADLRAETTQYSNDSAVGDYTVASLALPPDKTYFILGSMRVARTTSTAGGAYVELADSEGIYSSQPIDPDLYPTTATPHEEYQIGSPFCVVDTGEEGKTISLVKSLKVAGAYANYGGCLVALDGDRLGGIQKVIESSGVAYTAYGATTQEVVATGAASPCLGTTLVVGGGRTGLGRTLWGSGHSLTTRMTVNGSPVSIQHSSEYARRVGILSAPLSTTGEELTVSIDISATNTNGSIRSWAGDPAVYFVSLDPIPVFNKGEADVEVEFNVDIEGDIAVISVVHDAGEVSVDASVGVSTSPNAVRQSAVFVTADIATITEPGAIRTGAVRADLPVGVTISGDVVKRTSYFRDNLLRFLPSEFAYQDRNIGDLEDFLQVVALSMDEFDSFIEEFTTIFDVDTCETKYLPYLAKMIGYPLSERDDEDSQRTQLREAVSWYKRKGLTESFRILFYSLGYVINLVELWTKDYETFHKYPGSFLPRVFRAEVFGTSAPTVSVSSNTCALRIRIDGSPAVDIRLTPDVSKPLETIAQEIQVRLVDVGGQCVVDGGQLVIRSLESGQESSVRLEDVPLSAYSILGLYPGTWYGFDPVVPDYFDELKENGGEWYKSPHFGIEVFAIKDYVLDPEEFWYIRDRIELVRPAHTVLDWIDYVKALADTFSVSESDFIAELTPGQIDVWPFPICIDRGENSQFEYLRDGLVPNRSEVTRVAYQHYRLVVDTAPRRNQFEYEYYILSRDSETGPTPMPTRGEIHYYRDGMPIGDPKRDSCGYDVEEVNIHLAWEEAQSWCIALYRDGGAKYRDQPDTWYRDGSFTLVTSRDPYYLDRDGLDMLLDRSGCYPPLDADLGLLFERPDLPGVWFTSLDAMSDPESLGITELLPQPGEDGPGI